MTVAVFFADARYSLLFQIDISEKECRDVPWNVSTGVSGHAYLISGDD
jgi:hypothetical protein